MSLLFDPVISLTGIFPVNRGCSLQHCVCSSEFFFPSQRNAVDTQQPLQNPGEAAPGRAKHAQHPRAHPQCLQQQPLRVRAPPSALWALLRLALRFCFTLLCFVISKGLWAAGLYFMDLHFYSQFYICRQRTCIMFKSIL